MKQYSMLYALVYAHCRSFDAIVGRLNILPDPQTDRHHQSPESRSSKIYSWYKKCSLPKMLLPKLKMYAVF